MAKASSSASWHQAEVVLTGTIVAFVTVAALYWAKVVFIPLALAIFLTFLLSPLVLVLQRRGLGRIPSVMLVVLLAALVVGGIGWLVTHQVGSLIADLPNHTEKIKEKIRSLRAMTGDPLTDRLEGMMEEITRELKPKQTEAKPADTPRLEQPTPVVVQPTGSSWYLYIPAVLGPFLDPLGALALASILAVFMLWKREDLRNRFIRLIGRSRMALTTKAVDDAAERVSRYLLMQFVVNSTYGLAWGVGLFFLKVEYALLWGFIAAVLRYVPYIGAPIAALLPITLSLVTSDDWVQPLLVIVLLIVLELVSNNVIEPWLYGQSIGVSEVAMIIAATFWAFLWGPIGLVLSGPLMVCLVVLGKHVPQLEFFDVLLGDAPPLPPAVTTYQRLLAGDQDEAEDLVQARLKEIPQEQVFDDLLIPVLTRVKRDRQRDELTDNDERFILQAVQEIIEDLDVRPNLSGPPVEEAPEAFDNGSGALTPVRILGCAARDELDELSLHMLQHVLDPAKWEMTIAPVTVLASELLTQIEQTEPAIVCIANLPPGGLAHTRYLCKRVRARFPEIKIIVGRWGVKGNLEPSRESLTATGADDISATLLETCNHMNGWHSALAAQAEPNELVPTGERV